MIKYEYVDGAHFFTSEAEILSGLCAAHKELPIAITALGEQLIVLMEKNQGVQKTYVINNEG